MENVHQNAETPVPQRFPHFHGPAELVLIKAGNGEFISEDKPVRFSTGSLIFVPPMEHRLDSKTALGRAGMDFGAI